MGSITGYTAAKMQSIIDATISSAAVVSGRLIMTLHNGSTVDAGGVTGPAGPTGPTGVSGNIPTGLSSAHPSSPAVGQVFFETDTFKLVQYQSSTTGWTQIWNMPWGFINYNRPNITVATVGATYADLTDYAITAVLVVGRRYKVTSECLLSKDSTSGVATVQLLVGGVVKNYRQKLCQINDYFTMSFSDIFIPSAGGATVIKLQGKTTAGNMSTVINTAWAGLILLEDIGPAANPA